MKTLNGTRFMALAACLALALGAASPAAAVPPEKFTGFFCTFDWTGFAPPVNGSTTFTSSVKTKSACIFAPQRDMVKLDCKTVIPDWLSQAGVIVDEIDVACDINVARCGIVPEGGGEIASASASKLKIGATGRATLFCEFNELK